jgi:O-antigen/teichoic acid export membrane protein
VTTGGYRPGTTSVAPVARQPSPAPSPSPAAAAPGPKRPDLASLAIWTTLAQVALPVTSLISGPILARVLGPDGRGVYAAVLSPLQVLAFIANVGLPDATTYAVARLKIPKPHIVAIMSKVTLVYSIIAAALLIGFAPLLLHKTPQAVTLLQLTALTLPAQMFLTILRMTTSGSADFKWRNVERFVSAVLRLVGLVLFAILGWLTASSAVWVTVITSLVGVPILLVALFGWRVTPKLKSDPAVRAAHPHLTRQLMRYGFRGWGGTFAYLVNWRLDQAIMVVLVDARQLGFYAVAVSLAELPQTAFIQLRNILFAESAARDDMYLIARGCRVLVAVTVVMAGIGALISPFLVPFMFGHAFEPSVFMSQLLLIGTIPFLVGQVLGGGLLSLGLPFRASAGQLVGAVFTVVGLFLLTPHIGAVGAAWTSLTAYTVNATVCGTIFCRETGIRPRQLLIITREDIRWLSVRMQRITRKGKGSGPSGGAGGAGGTGGAGGAGRAGGAQVSGAAGSEAAVVPEPTVTAEPTVAAEPAVPSEPAVPVFGPAGLDEPPTVPLRAHPAPAPAGHAHRRTPADRPPADGPRPGARREARVYLGEEAHECSACRRPTVHHAYEVGRPRWFFFGPPAGTRRIRSICLGCGESELR